MRTLQSRNQPRLIACAVLIACALFVTTISPFTVSAAAVPTEQTILLQTDAATPLQGTFQVVNAGQGNQTSPSVDCDLMSYTNDVLGQSMIHYQNLSTGVDNEIWFGNGVDFLSDVSGSRIAYTEASSVGDSVRIFDTATQLSTVVAGVGLSDPSIGGTTVAFEDIGASALPGARDIDVSDVTNRAITKLAHNTFENWNPEVSPNGDAVIWAQCTPGVVGCDVIAAVQTSPGVFTTRALTSGNREGRFQLSTDGEVAVYVSNRNGENDIYYQPLTGGTEVHLSIPGDQRQPTISGGLISFESTDQNGYDIFVYDTRTGKVFQATNTPANESLSEVNVCGGTGRIVYVNVGNGGFDSYAFTFQVPTVPTNTEAQLDDLISLVRSFNLPVGTANSLIRKLQNAIDAANASDTATACDLLTSFINECQAQSGKKLTPAQSTQLINSANQIKTSLGCP